METKPLLLERAWADVFVSERVMQCRGLIKKKATMHNDIQTGSCIRCMSIPGSICSERVGVRALLLVSGMPRHKLCLDIRLPLDAAPMSRLWSWQSERTTRSRLEWTRTMAWLGHVEKILVFQASRTLNFGSLLLSFADVAQSAIDVAVPTCAHQVVHHVCGQHGVRQRTCLDIKLHAGTAVDQIGSTSPADLQTTIIVSTEELSRWLMRAMTSRCAWKVQFCNQLAFSIRTPSLG